MPMRRQWILWPGSLDKSSTFQPTTRVVIVGSMSFKNLEQSSIWPSSTSWRSPFLLHSAVVHAPMKSSLIIIMSCIINRTKVNTSSKQFDFYRHKIRIICHCSFVWSMRQYSLWDVAFQLCTCLSHLVCVCLQMVSPIEACSFSFVWRYLGIFALHFYWVANLSGFIYFTAQIQSYTLRISVKLFGYGFSDQLWLHSRFCAAIVNWHWYELNRA